MSFPVFILHQPQTVDEALGYMAEFVGRYTLMAGGTDLMPDYAQHLNALPHVISLSGIPSMNRLSASSIGACVTLSEVIRNGQMLPPVIVEVARGIAGPAVRSSATVGGNLMLGGRCRFFNQSVLSRAARGSCMKAGGSGCLSVVQEESCYAISSGDLVPVMLALGASFRLDGPDGKRLVPAADFYLPDGIQANVLEPSEVLTKVILPDDACELSAGYMKLGGRSAIDFPEAGVAVAVKRRPNGTSYGEVDYCRVAFGSLGPSPLVLTITRGDLDGLSADDLSEQIWKTLSPEMHAVRNGKFRPGYRKTQAKEYLKTLLARLLALSPTSTE